MTGPSRPVRFPPDTRPMLLTAIHTEEEFDWSRPFDSRCCEVTHLRELGRAVEIFDRLGVTPTYLLDYPVASREDGVRAVTEAIGGTGAAIGAHLHPWVNPPVTEAITRYNSYPGNLPPALERAKLATLTDCIVRNLGRHPTTYLAGRYGFGVRTLSILQELGYRVDLSPVAMGDFRGDGGPDFRDWASDCRWEGSPPILRVPHSAADTGMLCRGARRLVDPERVAALRRLRVPGILARLGAVRRIRLTPEGFSLSEMIAAAHALIAAGVRVMIFSFHSPSLAAGFTPYVRDAADRTEFLHRVDGFLRFFKEEVGGGFALPETILAAAEKTYAHAHWGQNIGAAPAVTLGHRGQGNDDWE